MYNTIKAYVDYNDYRKTHYYRNFEIVDLLPEIGSTLIENNCETETVIEIKSVTLDVEQPSDKVYDYDYFCVITEYVCTLCEDEEPERSENEYYYAVEAFDTDSYEFLKQAVIKNPSQENIKALVEWFDCYGIQFWDGECYDADDFCIYPIDELNEETDEYETVGYEIR